MFRQAVDAINEITLDEESIDYYFRIANSRCQVLVAHYAPEIEAVAAVLLKRKKLSGFVVRAIVSKSFLARRAGLLRY